MEDEPTQTSIPIVHNLYHRFEYGDDACMEERRLKLNGG